MTKTPRQRRQAKIKNTILDAAVQLIETQGFANTSLREIAKRADYSPAGLYKHFDGKSAILEAVQRRENERLIALLETVGTDLAPTQRLLEYCRIYIQYSLDNRAFLALVNNLTSERRSKGQPIPQTSPYQLFYDAVAVWVRDESIKLDETYGIEEITYAIWAHIHGMATLRLNQLRDFEADFDSTNRRTIQIYLNGLRNG